jgi:hypothetical protein
MKKKPIVKISSFWGKKGKHKNALNFNSLANATMNSLTPAPSTSITKEPLIKGNEKPKNNWLLEMGKQKTTALAQPSTARNLSQYELMFEKYDGVVTRLMYDLSAAAKWGQLLPGSAKAPKVIKHKGGDIAGWGWLLYRLHSSGLTVLPDKPEPQNFTVFNFWQINFSSAMTTEFERDTNTWNLHAVNTLGNFDRLTMSEVEAWLKQQIYQMYKGGCLWVALPDLLDVRGKLRKPTIDDALHAYNVMSYGRCYDPFQTESHFYDRPPFQNQFIPGFFKR